MRFREVALSEVPDIDDISVEYKRLWFDASQILMKLFGVAAERSEMNVANDYRFD